MTDTITEMQNRHWYVIQTFAGREDRVVREMRDSGFYAAYPVRREYRHRSRYTKGKKKKILREYPVAAGYIFVGFKTGERIRWHDLLSPNYVIGILGTNGTPIRARGREVVAMFKAEKAGRYDAPEVQRDMHTKLEFAKGDMVEIIDDSFAGYCGKVIEINAEGSAIVELPFFGSLRPTKVPTRSVIKSAS